MRNLKTSLLLTILPLFIVSLGFTQNINELTPGTHIKSDSITVFEGKWRSVSTSFTLTLDLSKDTLKIGSVNIDAIIGFHSLAVNEQVIFSNERPKKISNLLKSASFSAKESDSDPNMMTGYLLLDPGSRYKFYADLSSDNQEMTLTLSPNNPKGIFINEEPLPERYELPEKIVFERVH